jgi:hypothetical protein
MVTSFAIMTNSIANSWCHTLINICNRNLIRKGLVEMEEKGYIFHGYMKSLVLYLTKLFGCFRKYVS